jgi:predicted RNA-binding Zn ribbon-like protein
VSRADSGDGAFGAAGSAGVAARRAAALVAVLRPDRPRERVEATQVIGVLRDHGEAEPILVTATDVEAMRSVAADLWRVFAAPDVSAAAERLNAMLARTAGSPRLTDHAGTGWHLHLDATDEGPWAAWFATSSAMALATVIADRQAKPGGLCAAAGCGTPFADLGRGDPRRYCSPRCATRERVAAHRRRQAAGAAR